MYALGRFIAGIVCDRVDAALILSLCLFTTGIMNFISECLSFLLICSYFGGNYVFILCTIRLGLINVIFAQTRSTMVWTGLWLLNGLAQAFAWPAVSVVLIAKFAKIERGRYWSLVSISQNLGEIL